MFMLKYELEKMVINLIRNKRKLIFSILYIEFYLL